MDMAAATGVAYEEDKLTLEFKQFQPRTIDAVQIGRRDQLDEAVSLLIGCDAEGAGQYYTVTVLAGSPDSQHFRQAEIAWNRDEPIIIRPGDYLVKRFDRGRHDGRYEIASVMDLIDDWEPVDTEVWWYGRGHRKNFPA